MPELLWSSISLTSMGLSSRRNASGMIWSDRPAMPLRRTGKALYGFGDVDV